MQVVNNWPPNIAKIKTFAEIFPGVVFTYGNIIYNPFNVEIQSDLMVHEQVHMNQQGEFPEEWWNRYCRDIDFRLRQEVEAYGEQYLFIKKHVGTKRMKSVLFKMADALSSALYGKIIDFQKAEQLIRTYRRGSIVTNSVL